MALSKGQEVKEVSFKRYIGVAPCSVLAVNPNKDEMEKLMGMNLTEEPNYITEQDGVKSARISFIVEPVTDEAIPAQTVTFFLRNEARENRDGSKVQVIDKYGRTAWVTKDELENHEIPIYSNGKPANIDKDYRPCYVGEENLTDFFKAYLGIPDVMKYNKDNNEWYLVDDPEKSECRLDSIPNYFKGNFKEIEDALKLQPMNKVIVLFGVKTKDDGKLAQVAYTNMFLKGNARNYDRLSKDLNERKAAGSYATTDFIVAPLEEYSPAPSVIKEEESDSDLPF